MRQSIYKYLSAQITLNPSQIGLVVDYLIRNQTLLMDENETAAILRSRSVVGTAMSQIFGRGMVLGDTQIFTLLRRVKDGSVPEALTMRHLPFDLTQMADIVPRIGDAIATLPILKDKVVINTAQLLKANGEVADLMSLQGIVVRDLLSRSFYESRTRSSWLNPGLTQFVCKIYSMSLGASVAQWYNLDYKQQGFVTALFALFYLGMMTTAPAAQAMLMSQWKLYQLPEPKDLGHIYGLVKDTLGKVEIETLDDVFSVINGLGIDRVNQLDRNSLLRKLQTLGPDVHTSALSLEYPPYFIYLILLSLSGSKIGLSFRIKANNVSKDAARFVDELAKTNSFLGMSI